MVGFSYLLCVSLTFLALLAFALAALFCAVRSSPGQPLQLGANLYTHIEGNNNPPPPTTPTPQHTARRPPLRRRRETPPLAPLALPNLPPPPLPPRPPPPPLAAGTWRAFPMMTSE